MATKPLPPAVCGATTALAVVNDIVKLLRLADRCNSPDDEIVHELRIILRHHQVPFAGDNHDAEPEPKNFMGTSDE